MCTHTLYVVAIILMAHIQKFNARINYFMAAVYVHEQLSKKLGLGFLLSVATAHACRSAPSKLDHLHLYMYSVEWITGSCGHCA